MQYRLWKQAQALFVYNGFLWKRNARKELKSGKTAHVLNRGSQSEQFNVLELVCYESKVRVSIGHL